MNESSHQGTLRNVQNVKAPEITPLAIAVGKMKCANFVIGVDKTTKSTGGMTSLNLSGVSRVNTYLVNMD